MPVEMLSPTSGKKVDVRCPDCGETRRAYYRVVVAAGHTVCRRCNISRVQAKELVRGSRFGSLVVVEEAQLSGRSVCLCDCGVYCVKANYSLTIGKTKSCGCLRAETFKHIPRGRGNWKGGISGDRERDMATNKYKEWRQAVFEKDCYTCQKCGQVGYDLNAHHIFPYSKHEDKRTSLDNGITLCKKCHIAFHNIYGRDNDDRQINDYCREAKA